VIALSLLLAGCGVARLPDNVFGPTPLVDTNLVTPDSVIVNFRVEELAHHGALEFRFNGSVKNLGPPLSNARFEVVATRNVPDPTGVRSERIVTTQSYGRLDTNQTQVIAAVAELPAFENARVRGRFVHD
jgi:hypothetical protein